MKRAVAGLRQPFSQIIKSSTLHSSASDIRFNASSFGFLIPRSQFPICCGFTPIASASCDCVKPAFIRFMAIGDDVFVRLGAPCGLFSIASPYSAVTRIYFRSSALQTTREIVRPDFVETITVSPPSARPYSLAAFMALFVLTSY